MLIVCTANICRSPLAERVIADRMSKAVEEGRIPAGLISVESAGTHASTGAPMCAQSAAQIDKRFLNLVIS